MIAALPMYDLPQLQAANDAFWHEIRAHLGRGPETLTRDVPDLWAIWRSPQLLLAQTCGLPLRARLYGEVQLVGTPDYGLPGCPEGHYNSVIITSPEHKGTGLRNLAGTRFAYNDPLSQSGWAAPMMHMRPLDMLPGSLHETGSHRASVAAVANGEADFAAIDALTWQMLLEYDPLALKVVELERTDPTPALPYITANTEDPQPLFDALKAAIESLADTHRSALHLKGMVPLTTSDYLAIPTPPGPTLVQDRLSKQHS